MAGLMLVRVHEPDAVREILKEARAVADESGLLDARWDAAFNKAVDLLAARIPLQQMPDLGVSFDALGMRR